MKPTDVLIRNPVAVLREEADDWAILFNPDTCEAVGTNPVGVRIWKLINGKRRVEEITEAVCKRFRDVPASAAAEVTEFLARLVDRGFAAIVP